MKTAHLLAIITILHRAWNLLVSRALHHTILREVLSKAVILVHLDLEILPGQKIHHHVVNLTV